MASKARKRRSKILLFPQDHELKSVRNKLPAFDPHDPRSLITEAKTNDKADVERVFLLALRRRNENQMKELLRRLGVDPSTPDAWKRGFFHLAVLHHGAGHLAWYAPRTNRNSATWTPAQDFGLLMEVLVLKQKGSSERDAVKKLASNPKKRQLFPYRKQGYFSTADEAQNREAALWARLQKLKARTRGNSIANLLQRPSLDSLSSMERRLYDFALSSLLPKTGENQRRSKKTRS
jgi:hypothetical protein